MSDYTEIHNADGEWQAECTQAFADEYRRLQAIATAAAAVMEEGEPDEQGYPIGYQGAAYRWDGGECNYCGGGDLETSRPTPTGHNEQCEWLKLYRALGAS